MIHDDHEFEGWLMNGKVGRAGKEIHRLNYYFKHNCGSGHSSYFHNFRNPVCTPIQGMPAVTCKKCLKHIENWPVPQEITILDWFLQGWKWRDVRVWFINWHDRHPQPWRVYAIWEGHDVDSSSLSQQLLWFEKTELVEKDGGKSYEWVGKSQTVGDLSYKWPVSGTDKIIVIPVNKDDGWKTRVGQHVVYDGKEMVIHRHATESYCRIHGWKEAAWCLTPVAAWEDYQTRLQERRLFAIPVVPPPTSVALVETVVQILAQNS